MAIGQTLQGPTDFYSMNGEAANSIGSISGIMNGLAYYNGRAYASRVTSNVVLEISLVGGNVAVTDSFAVNGIPAANIDAGAVRTGTSDYYVYQRKTASMYRIPLEDRGASFSPLALERSLNTADFVFLDDQIVGHDKQRKRVYSIDPDAGTVEYAPGTALGKTFYAATYEVDGALYLYRDSDKQIFVADPSTGDVVRSFASAYTEPTSQVDAASCPDVPANAACEPILFLRADVLALALPQAVEEDLLSDLDAALFNCSPGRYTLTAAALAEFLTAVGLETGVTISVEQSELLTAVAQFIISGLPEDTTGNECTPILGLRADVLDLGLSDALENALLADLDLALISCASGLVPDLIAALSSFTGTVGANAGPLAEISLLEAATLTAAAQAIAALFPDPSRAGLDSADRADARAGAGAAVEAAVFPNPASTRATVQAQGPFQAKVYDLVGRVVLELESASSTADVEVSSLSPGLYVFRIDAADGVHTAKVVVTR